MKKRKLVSLALSGALVFGALAGCGNGNEGSTNSTAPQNSETANNESSGAFEISMSIASEPQTIDPALNSAVDGAIMINHMFEGLMRWEDSGSETGLHRRGGSVCTVHRLHSFAGGNHPPTSGNRDAAQKFHRRKLQHSGAPAAR